MNNFIGRMGFRIILVLVLVSACVLGQSLPSVRGIRVISSTVDLTTGQREITFMNDSTADITAYEVVSINVHPDGSTSRSTTSRELFNPEWHSQLKHRPFLPETPPTGGVIHPGESVTLKWNESGGQTAASTITSAANGVDVAIYSDGTAEAFNTAQLEAFIAAREQSAREYATIAAVGRRVLANSNDTDAFSSMRDTLAAEERSGRLSSSRAADEFSRVLLPSAEERFTGNLLESLIREHRRKGDTNQREILKEFIADQDEMAAAWQKAAEIRALNR